MCKYVGYTNGANTCTCLIIWNSLDNMVGDVGDVMCRQAAIPTPILQHLLVSVTPPKRRTNTPWQGTPAISTSTGSHPPGFRCRRKAGRAAVTRTARPAQQRDAIGRCGRRNQPTGNSPHAVQPQQRQAPPPWSSLPARAYCTDTDIHCRQPLPRCGTAGHMQVGPCRCPQGRVRSCRRMRGIVMVEVCDEVMEGNWPGIVLVTAPTPTVLGVFQVWTCECAGEPVVCPFAG